MKLEIFDPPMCCPTGICGPSVDDKLVILSQNLEILKNKYAGIEINRYMITQQPQKFRDNQEVFATIKEKGKEVLPITTVNGRIIKVSGYPSLEEIEKELGAV